MDTQCISAEIPQNMTENSNTNNPTSVLSTPTPNFSINQNSNSSSKINIPDANNGIKINNFNSQLNPVSVIPKMNEPNSNIQPDPNIPNCQNSINTIQLRSPRTANSQSNQYFPRNSEMQLRRASLAPSSQQRISMLNYYMQANSNNQSGAIGQNQFLAQQRYAMQLQQQMLLQRQRELQKQMQMQQQNGATNDNKQDSPPNLTPTPNTSAIPVANPASTAPQSRSPVPQIPPHQNTMQNSNNMQNANNIQNAHNIQNFNNKQNFNNIQSVNNIQNFNNIQSTNNIQNFNNIQSVNNIQNVNNLPHANHGQNESHGQNVNNVQNGTNMQDANSMQYSQCRQNLNPTQTSKPHLQLPLPNHNYKKSSPSPFQTTAILAPSSSFAHTSDGIHTGFYNWPSSKSNQDLANLKRELKVAAKQEEFNSPILSKSGSSKVFAKGATYQSQQSKQSNEQVTFELNLNLPAESIPPLPIDADKIWARIQDPDEPVTFTELLDHVYSNVNPSNILAALSQDKSLKTSSISIELSRHLNYMHRIFRADELIAFTSNTRLDPATLRASLKPRQLSLFDCVIILLDKILKGVNNDNDKKLTLRNFSEYLIPSELISPATKRSRLLYLIFLPIKSVNGDEYFITVHTNKNNVRIYSKDTPGKVLMSFSLDKVNSSVRGDHLIFVDSQKNGAPMLAYKFTSGEGAFVWNEAFSSNNYDPLLTFMTCIPQMLEYCDGAPKEFFDQICALISSPDLELAQAICEIGKTQLLGQEAFEKTQATIKMVLSLLSERNLLCQFIRASFQDEIDHTNKPDTIFRESSVATMISGILMSSSDIGFADQVCKVLTNNITDLNNAVLAFTRVQKLIQTHTKFVCCQAFKATRRKYPNNLVPLSATSAILFLRYLIPYFLKVSKELTIFSQKLINPFVFSLRDDPKYSVEARTYHIIVRYLLMITKPKDDQISIRSANTKEIIIDFLKSNFEQLLIHLPKIIYGKNEHALKFSILEILENYFNGTDENYEKRMFDKTLFPSD